MENDDEQELIFLDTDHPMVLRYQEGMKKQLRNYLERLALEIEEKRASRKDRERRLQDLQDDVLKSLKDLSSKKAWLEELTVAADKARDEHLKVQDKLEKIKTDYDMMKNEKNKLENDVHQKQAELDDLNLKLHYTQKHSDALHGDVKAKKNFNQKSRTQRKKAEEQMLQQDLCIERLTKELERVTEQIKMYELQITAQSEKKERARSARSEAEMLLEDMLLQHKWIQQQWISSLQMMGKTVERRNAAQEAVSAAVQEVNLLDREIQRNRKTNSEKQEENEKLTEELQMAQIQCEAIKRTINKKKDEEEALLAQYSSYKSSLKEAENTLLRLKKESSAAQSALNNDRKQLEKESARRLELEAKIKTQMQQVVILGRTARNYQQLFSKLSDAKDEKMTHLLQLENEIAAVENKRTKVASNMDALTIILESQEKEIAEKAKHVASRQAEICSHSKEIEQNQRTIQNIKNKMAEMAARTGNEDLSPYEIKIRGLKEQRRELEETVKSRTQLWLTRQETRVRLSLEHEATNKVLHKLQIESTTLQKRRMRLEGLMEIERCELKQLQNKAKVLTGSLEKFNTQIHQNGKQRLLLEERKMMMEMDFLGRIKEAEQTAASIQMKYDRTEEEKENLGNCLMESVSQKMLWERKIQLAKETRSELKKQNEELHKLKMEVHKKETQLNCLVKQGEKLMKESEALAERWGHIAERRLVLRNASDKIRHNRKCEMERSHEAQQRNLAKMKKQLRVLDEELQELGLGRSSAVEDVEEKKEELAEHHLKNQALDAHIGKLQGDRARNLVLAEALQNWAKHLRKLRDGSAKAPSGAGTAAAALGREAENLRGLYDKVLLVCQERPESQEELREIRIALEAHMMFLKT